MPRIQRSLIAFAFLLSLLSAPRAFAVPGLELGVMAGAAASMPTGVLDGGIGLSVGATGGVGPLEASLLYTQYKLSIPGNDITGNYLDIPVLYRMSLGPVGLGIGGFYSMFLSRSSTVVLTGDGESNYGATASLRFTIPVVGLFLDGRYNLGLKDSNGSKASSAAFYLGFNFL
jgi:hypothetical protein